MSIKAIDISTWQQNVDFNKVKASGITAVLIRAGFGREISQKDSQFENHYRGAKAAGLKVGAYWYSYANTITDAAREAAACLACIEGKSFDLPIYYDMEESSQTGYGKSTLTAMATSFCEAIKAGGYRAGVYANLNWFNNYLNYSSLKSRYSIWLAQWSSSHSLSCDIWQYGDDGTVPGISGSVDMNIIENPDIINGGSGGGGKEVYCDISMPYLAQSGYISTGEEVKTVQLLMNAMNYGKLKVDGIFGSATDEAVKRFQKSRKLEQDGIVGADTWRYLLK